MLANGRTMREIWQTVQGYTELMLPQDVWTLNIQPLQAVAWHSATGTLTLAAPTTYARDWCAVRLDRLIRRELGLETGRDITINYIVQPSREETPC